MKTVLRMDASELQSVLIHHMLRTRPMPEGKFDIRFKLIANGADSYAELTIETPEGVTFDYRNKVEVNNLAIEK